MPAIMDCWQVRDNNAPVPGGTGAFRSFGGLPHQSEDWLAMTLLLLLLFHLSLEVDRENCQRSSHILILHQNTLGDIQVDGGKVPDGLDTTFNHLITDGLGMLGGYSNNTQGEKRWLGAD